MPVASIHVFTVGSTQYDLRQAVMWSVISATEIRVNYRGTPQQTWVTHVLADWVAAKQTSLGSTFALCPHLFAQGSTYWDVRFAAQWFPYGSGVKVYYEATQDATWVEHPDLAAWELVKQASLDAGG